jgi:CRP/FNR family cyclic AMP-dependent transcriptional regulator
VTSGQPDLVKGLTADEAADVLGLGTRLCLTSGAELFPLGAAAESVYVITRGRVSLTLPMQVQGHHEDIQVEERLPGQTVGWSALIPPHRFTLKATVPLETEVLAIGRTALLGHFASRPQVGYVVTSNLAAVIGERLQVFQAMWLREMQRVIELRSA